MNKLRLSRMLPSALFFCFMQLSTYAFLLVPEHMYDYGFFFINRIWYLSQTVFGLSIYTYMICTFSLATIVSYSQKTEQIILRPVLIYAVVSTVYDTIEYIFWAPSQFSNFIESGLTISLIIYLWVIRKRMDSEKQTPAMNTWADLANQMSELAHIARMTDGQGAALKERVRLLSDMMNRKPILDVKGWPAIALFDYQQNYHFTLEVKPDLLIKQPYAPLARMVELLNELALEPEQGDMPLCKIYQNKD